MGKRICGIILLAVAAIAIVGGIANGTLFSSNSGARGAGNLVGTLIAYAALIIGGIALIAKSKKN